MNIQSTRQSLSQNYKLPLETHAILQFVDELYDE